MNATEDPETGDDGGSPPCSMHELGDDGTSMIDPRQSRDVARWRKAERERQIALRLAMSAGERNAATAAISADLDRLIPAGFSGIVSAYWPIRAEPDLRPWIRERSAGGAQIALPVALELGKPLIFREWRPGAPLTHGLWKIPYPADGAEVTPTIALAPLVAFDRKGYRLGYGGGFFDRTLAATRPRPLAIGLGYEATAIRTIFPQPHDIPMDWIVTGSAPPRRFERRGG